MSAPFFFFNDTATTEIYTLSLHDALPISQHSTGASSSSPRHRVRISEARSATSDRAKLTRKVIRECPCRRGDRKSTRLNSSHGYISYAVFCLKKKKKQPDNNENRQPLTHI